jgi:hypothetical protein
VEPCPPQALLAVGHASLIMRHRSPKS